MRYKRLTSLLDMKLFRALEGPGFKIVFHAGTGFFDDYEEFYLRSSSKPTIGKLPARAWLDPQPLKLVAYFHQLLGRRHDTFAEKEKKQASELLGRYTEREVRDLIDYAVARIKSTNFKAEFFGAVMNYQPTWSVHQRFRGGPLAEQRPGFVARHGQAHGLGSLAAAPWRSSSSKAACRCRAPVVPAGNKNAALPLVDLCPAHGRGHRSCTTSRTSETRRR